MIPSERFLAIDEEGYVVSNDVRWTDVAAGGEVLHHLSRNEQGVIESRSGGSRVLIEAFDEPLVATNIEKSGGKWRLSFRYDQQDEFDPATLKLDPWDRVHGRTVRGVPFVLSRSAQARWFDLVDDFDDDSITIDGHRLILPPLWNDHPEVNSGAFWTDRYREATRPGWDLGQPAEALKDMLPRLRLPRSRILVAGCGEGHDAAHFARDGHIVTAMDISAEALERARSRYGDLPHLTFLQGDVFEAPLRNSEAFDVVFEHTLFCAINPRRRNDLINAWWRLLAPNGHLMAIFFAVEMNQGPPFGGSEWELRERLRRKFRFLFWGRWQKSVPGRQGKELFVYAQKVQSG